MAGAWATALAWTKNVQTQPKGKSQSAGQTKRPVAKGAPARPSPDAGTVGHAPPAHRSTGAPARRSPDAGTSGHGTTSTPALVRPRGNTPSFTPVFGKSPALQGGRIPFFRQQVSAAQSVQKALEKVDPTLKAPIFPSNLTGQARTDAAKKAEQWTVDTTKALGGTRGVESGLPASLRFGQAPAYRSNTEQIVKLLREQDAGRQLAKEQRQYNKSITKPISDSLGRASSSIDRAFKVPAALPLTKNLADVGGKQPNAEAVTKSLATAYRRGQTTFNAKEGAQFGPPVGGSVSAGTHGGAPTLATFTPNHLVGMAEKLSSSLANAGANAVVGLSKDLPLPIAALNPITLAGHLLPEKFAKNAAQDYLNLPVQSFASLFHPAVSLATGHPGKAAHQFIDPLIETAKHPLKSLEQHPFATALIAAGGLRGADRGVGAVARKVAPERFYAGPTEIRGPGPLVRERNYSRGAAQNQLEKVLEAGKAPRGARAKARKAGGVPQQAVELGTGKTRKVFTTPHKQAKTVKSQMDFLLSQAEQAHRTNQAVSLETAQLPKRGKGLLPAARGPRQAIKALMETDTLKHFVAREVRPGHVVEDLKAILGRYKTAEAELLAKQGSGNPRLQEMLAAADKQVADARAAGHSVADATATREAISKALGADRTPVEHGKVQAKLLGNRDSQASIEALLADKRLNAVAAHGLDAVKGLVAEANRGETRKVAAEAMGEQRIKAKLVPAAEAFTDTKSGKGIRLPTDAGAEIKSYGEAVKEAAKTEKGAARAVVRAKQATAREQGRVSTLLPAADAAIVKAHPEVRAALQTLKEASQHLKDTREAAIRADPRAKAAAADFGKARAALRANRTPENQAALKAAGYQLGKARLEVKKGLSHPQEQAAVLDARKAYQEARSRIGEQQLTKGEHGPIERSATGQVMGQPRAAGTGIRALDRLERARAVQATAEAGHRLAVENHKTARASHRMVTAANRGKALTRQPWRVDATGAEVTAEDVAQALKEKGVIKHPDEIGFVPHRGGRGAGAYSRGPVKLTGEHTPPEQATGEAARGGIVHVTSQDAIESPLRSHSIAEHAMLASRLVRNFSFGDFATPKDAINWAVAHAFEHHKDGGATVFTDQMGMRWVPVDVGSFFDTATELAKRRESLGLQSADEAAKTFVQAWEKLGSQPETGHGRIALMPHEAWKRLSEHDAKQNPSDWVKTAQRLSQQWRQTVLLTSTRWLTGNAVELTFRLAANGVTPFDVLRGYKWFAPGKYLERVGGKEAADLFRAGTVGGGHYGGQGLLRIHRDASQLSPHTPLRAVNAMVDKIGEKAVTRYLIRAQWRAWKHVFQGINTKIEKGGQYAILGHALKRDLHDLNRSAIKAINAAPGAYEDVANGLLNTPRQHRYAEYVYEVQGKYSGFGPTMKGIVRTIAPFLPWYLNALKFLYYTLPARHPLKTAVLAGLYVGNTDKLTAEGQSLFGKGHLPGFLLGSYLRGDNLRIPVFRYLPMGAMGSDPTQQILPQGDFMSILGGQDWKGGRLKNADGSDPDAMQLAAYAAYTMVEGLVPFMALGRRVRESGGTSAFGSTLLSPKTKATGPKPDSNLLKGLEKVTNPFYPQGQGGAKVLSASQRALKDQNSQLNKQSRELTKQAKALVTAHKPIPAAMQAKHRALKVAIKQSEAILVKKGIKPKRAKSVWPRQSSGASSFSGNYGGSWASNYGGS